MLASVFGEHALVGLHGRIPCAAPAGYTYYPEHAGVDCFECSIREGLPMSREPALLTSAGRIRKRTSGDGAWAAPNRGQLVRSTCQRVDRQFTLCPPASKCCRR